MRNAWADDLPRRAEVAVVGAGIAGCSIAYALARRGVRVSIVERETVAAGASGKNDGQLLLEAAEFYSRMTETLGRDRARAVLQFKVMSQDALAAFLAEKRLETEVEWSRRGCYFLASSPPEERELRASCRLLAEDGFGVEWHDAAEVRRRVGAGAFSGGLFVPNDALVNPLKLTRAIFDEALRAGATYTGSCPVREVRDGLLVTERGELAAEIIVLATNAWTGTLIGRRDLIWPIRGQILSTSPLPPFLEVGCSTNFGYEYWRQTRDGRIMAGGFRWTDEEREKGTDLALNDAIQKRIEEFVLTLYRERAAELCIEHRWCGIMGFSIDGLPLVGPLPGRPLVWLAGGFTGYGMSYGFGVGEAIAELITEGRTRFPIQPLATSRIAK